MHIHPSSPNSDISFQSEESAAIKIQAGFRGYRVRKQLTGSIQSRHSSKAYQGGLNSILRRQQRHQQSGMSQDQSKGVTLSVSNQLDEKSEKPSVEDKCATKIQAGVRGFLVRKKQKAESDAATKIQAGFRGFKARKDIQKIKQK